MVRRLRRPPGLGPWGCGFDHAWRDAARGVYAPTPAASWRFSAEAAVEYEAAYEEAHGIARG